MTGKDLIDNFLKRNKVLSLRKPQGVALNRIFGLNKPAVKRYLNNVEKIIYNNKLKVYQLYNCDETDLTCFHNPVKVFAQKVVHVFSSMTSGEILTVMTTGHCIPPLMIFKRMKPNLIDHAHVDTIVARSEIGLFMDMQQNKVFS